MLFVFGKRAKQGEIEQISLMKPKAQSAHDEGFLEYLEDIIGTNKYVEKIAESLKQSIAFFRGFVPVSMKLSCFYVE
ncbi:structural maintenance of chromosomes protein 4-like [Solanum lycopersicum]|uniref:structural maintenance of chromosomes protein 4-like n=1 Tax=Solanum lycopersicum TaxID=4081 RepID=UPI000532F676